MLCAVWFNTNMITSRPWLPCIRFFYIVRCFDWSAMFESAGPVWENEIIASVKLFRFSLTPFMRFDRCDVKLFDGFWRLYHFLVVLLLVFYCVRVENQQFSLFNLANEPHRFGLSFYFGLYRKISFSFSLPLFQNFIPFLHFPLQKFLHLLRCFYEIIQFSWT